MEGKGNVILRKNFRAQLTKCCNAMKDLVSDERSSSVKNEVMILVNKIKHLRLSIVDLNEKILPNISEDNLEAECEKITEYEMASIETLSMADIILQMDSKESRGIEAETEESPNVQRGNLSKVVSKTVRLPKVDFLKFDGSLENWPAFWEQFNEVIHSNPEIDTKTKFSYLKNQLTGKAALTISGILSNQSSYNDAIELLQSEFGKPERIIDLYIQRLYQIPPVKFDKDVTGLRRLYNTVISIVRSLNKLGVSTNQFGMTVKSVIIRALPLNLNLQFNRSQIAEANNERESVSGSDSNVGTIDYNKQIETLLQYIKIELDSLETAKDSFSKDHKEKMQGRENKIKKDDYTAQGLVTLNKAECLFCKKGNHERMFCRNSSIGLEEKKRILRENALCFRCLRANHISKFCKGNNLNCQNCKGRHLTVMCDPNFKPKRMEPTTNNSVTAFSTGSLETVYLQTATVCVKNNFTNNDHLLRLVIDGGSQLTFIRKNVSRRLKLPVVGRYRISICSFGNSQQGESKFCNKVEVTLKSKFSNENVTICAIETPEICFDALQQPTTKDPTIREFARNNLLADFGKTALEFPGISLLIGADNYWSIVQSEVRRLTNNLTAVNTIFGWTLHGRSKMNDSSSVLVNFNFVNVLHVEQIEIDDVSCIENNIKKFWDLEAIGINGNELNNENKEFTKNFIKKNISFKNGRYEVKLPWKDNELFDSNYSSALIRVKNLVRKLRRENKLIEYDKAVREFLTLKCAEPVYEARLNVERAYYLPHRPVYRMDRETTKVRVVFDAGAHGPGMPSLNDKLFTGDNLVPDVLKILMNFRIGAVALIADIVKAFLQISLNENDRDFHRFLWLKNPITEDNNLTSDFTQFQTFRMCRVTFGVTTSPFLLSATLRKHLLSQNDKELSRLLLNSFYVDDLVIAIDTPERALEIHERSIEMLTKASMNLRKWCSNDPNLRRAFSINDENLSSKKVLGMIWHPVTDQMCVDMPLKVIEVADRTEPTKRIILKTVASIFDPIGILCPITVKIKILLQEIWKLNLDWDCSLPENLKAEWNLWLRNADQLKEFYIDRCLIDNSINPIELHVFADASPKAYGAVVYIRNNSLSKFLIAKGRVAPLNNTLTLPKLELTAALCAARLQKFVSENLKLNIKKVYVWSDSKITIHWINGENSRWKPYIQNRVNEIRQMNNIIWRHCPGTHNPADLITRGLKTPKFLKESSLWLNGPEWLTLDESQWPSSDKIENQEIESAVAFLIGTNNNENMEKLTPIFSTERFHSLEKMLIVTAYVFRFISNSNKKEVIIIGKLTGKITTEEMERAEIYWLRITQQNEYLDEITVLKKKKEISRKSSILMLTPFIDSDGLLRVGGRLQEGSLEFSEKHPVILPKSSFLTEKIIWKAHNDTFHCGVNTTLSFIRQRYWIVQGRQKVKSLIRKCVLCKRLRGKAGTAPFAPLPKDRITADQPFRVTGIDFAGPLFVRINDNEKSKVYVMILTCAVIRAIHLELVENLITEHCLLALRRFIARRGVPHIIYSDNAKTFKRSALEIEQLFSILKSNTLQEFSRQERLRWKFISERAAWWGGFWERLVRSVKDSLKAVLKRKMIGLAELQTFLTEVESVINSRPLTYIDNDPTNLFILSPAKFLTGNIKTGLCFDFGIKAKRDDIVTRWKERERSIKKLWKIWLSNYLFQLRSAHMHKNETTSNFQEGDVVILHDQDRPRMSWKLVRIERTFPGRDGKIRCCEVITADKRHLRRPVQLLYPLEISGRPGGC